MREVRKDAISSSFDAQLYAQVFTCYQNKFKVIQCTESGMFCLLLIMFSSSN